MKTGSKILLGLVVVGLIVAGLWYFGFIDWKFVPYGYELNDDLSAQMYRANSFDYLSEEGIISEIVAFSGGSNYQVYFNCENLDWEDDRECNDGKTYVCTRCVTCGPNNIKWICEDGQDVKYGIIQEAGWKANSSLTSQYGTTGTAPISSSYIIYKNIYNDRLRYYGTENCLAQPILELRGIGVYEDGEIKISLFSDM